ncbi:MAG: NifU family protein [bacterium]
MKKYTVSIQPTSNDKIVKFETNQFLTNHQSFEFSNIDEAKDSPLAQQLFYLPFVKKVYISVNFVAIERYDIVSWGDVQDTVAEQIEDYLNNDGIVVIEDTVTKVAITVYAESTPNPAVLKFVSNKKLVPASYEFKSIDDAKDAPLVQKLFHFPFVKSVFVDENYISITKYDMAEWNDITLELREFIKNSLEQQITIVDLDKVKSSEETVLESNNVNEGKIIAKDPVSQEIINIIEEYVKPAVASDGGNIVFDSYNEESKKVKVILQGACSGCPSSTFTLKNGIENMLKEMLQDQALTVEAING